MLAEGFNEIICISVQERLDVGGQTSKEPIMIESLNENRISGNRQQGKGVEFVKQIIDSGLGFRVLVIRLLILEPNSLSQPQGTILGPLLFF